MKNSQVNSQTSFIRQPIVTVVGHVDHGKTSILDCIRGSCVQESEAGGITQKISFTLFPIEQAKKACPLIEKSGIKLTLPGFLFIDTPGHAAFTNLRKRGGSLADLAVLVIDINDGIKPQTAEVISILKRNKTPFLIALNKIDNISSWRKMSEDIQTNIEMQTENAKREFEEKYMTLIASLNSHGFEADLFYRISDFTKKIALVPCSAKTKEGIPELIMVLCGLSQKYLAERLKLGTDAKGVILEIKKEKSQNYIEAILYDGKLSKKDELAVASLSGEVVISRIRVLEEVLPLSSKFEPKEEVRAATGIRMQFTDKIEVLPGMPFVVFKNNLQEIKKLFREEISESVKTDKKGIIIKADSLGSLEALLTLLRQNNIPVVKAGIGKINKSDVVRAKANKEINELDCLILGFGVEPDDEVKELGPDVKIITGDVIYKLIEDALEYREQKKKEIERKRLMGLSPICKIKILPQYVFRNSNPAIFGVRVEAGTLTQDTPLIDENGQKVGRVKSMQSEKKSISEAKEGMELAISVPGRNFERQLKNINFLYSDITSSQFKKFKENKDLLSPAELQVLQEISQIKKFEEML